METIYILIKHENLIEIDKVEVLEVTKDKTQINNYFISEFKKANKQYKLLESINNYASFTDEYGEFLIELIIEKR